MSAQMTRVAELADLRAKGRLLIRHDGRQIALFHTGAGVFACNNRCPHEGYPLVEGTLGGACVLTCNWHNWKFHLDGGDNLTGGDHLRTYPVEMRDGAVWLDLADPPAAERIATALANLREAFPRYEYDRMAREIARLQRAGGDPLDAVRAAVAWTHDRFEYGATHAPAAAADWLALRRRYGEDAAYDLVPVIEVVGHFAWDSRREPAFPFAAGSAAYDDDALVAAIEAEDEVGAVALVRGALADRRGYTGLEHALTRAALAHYQDFGHALIYVFKTGQLIDTLGPGSAEPLLLPLVRGLVNAQREDLIPEFRHYATALTAWDGGGNTTATAADFRRLPVKRALDRAVAASADLPALYDALLGAAAWQLLHFELAVQARTDGPVSQNVGWLDFTHTVTFANAVRHQCTKFPELWPQGLLQLACFLGRNAPFVDADYDAGDWTVDDIDGWLDETRRGLFDHGLFEYIVACHMVKLTCAVSDEIAQRPDAPWVGTLAAALNRFLHSPLKRKHVVRTARQSLGFVALDG